MIRPNSAFLDSIDLAIYDTIMRFFLRSEALRKQGRLILTVEALTRYALQPDQRARLEMEARTGEHRVARAKVQIEQELQRLLDTSAADGKSIQATTPAANAGERKRKGTESSER